MAETINIIGIEGLPIIKKGDKICELIIKAL